MMLQIRNVTGTAFVVAEFRAEENDASHPLYRDHVVNLFLDERSRQAAARVATGFPPIREMVKIRTRYFDDMLERQLASGCRQVVVLGAGLDTRAIRKSAANVTYFEIDDAATLSLKQSCFEEHGIHANVRFLPGNYVTDGLIALLSRNGFDPELPTYIIWEGNTMYLPIESDKAIMDQLRDNLRAFHLSFDYLAEAVITKTTGEVGLTRMAEGFADMGAPWVTGFDNIRALARHVNLRLIDNVTSGDLYRRFRPHVSLDRPIFGPFYSVCTLASAIR
jgi:methyltransferase (TIGR00027 family)